MTEQTLEFPVGYVIFGDEGDIVHGTDWDPFGLPTMSVLVGEAVETARSWIEANPEAEFSLVAVHARDLAEGGPATGSEFVESISLKDQSEPAP